MSDYGYGSYTPPDGATPPSQLWPEGSYVGHYVRHTCMASTIQGTPGIQVYFLVQDREVQVDCWLTEGTLSSLTGDQLGAIGWNGQYGPECAFDPPEDVPLFMRYDEYKNRTRERWGISTVREASGQAMEATRRACMLWRQRRAAPAPVPAAPPATPGRPAPQPAAPAPLPSPSVPPTPARPLLASDADEAWAVWCSAGREDAEAFWAAIDAVGKGKAQNELTPVEWSHIAAAATGEVPF